MKFAQLVFYCSFCFCIFFCATGPACFGLDREAFTFTHYDLNLRVDPWQQRLEVRGKISLRNDSTSPQKNVSLQISSSLSWRSIQFEGKPVQFVSQNYTSDIDHTGELSEAVVTMPREVGPKGTVELEIGYEGVIVLDATRLTRISVPEGIAKHSDWDQISKTFTAVRGMGYVAWYPMGTEAASLEDGNGVFEAVARWKKREASAELKVSVIFLEPVERSAPQAVANGARTVRFSAGSGTIQYDDTSYVLSSVGAGTPTWVVGSLEAFESPAVVVYYADGHKSVAESYARTAGSVLPLVTEWFGAAKEKASVIELADPLATSFDSGAMLLTPLASFSDNFEGEAAHQLTHAAFPSSRPWIYEGLAYFAQALDRERHDGRRVAIESMSLQRALVVDAEKQIPGEVVTANAKRAGARDSLIETSDEQIYRSKAVLVWWMLRDLAGDVALKAALANYHPEEDRDASYMQRLIEKESKRDLQWFFDDWVYNDRGLPDFRVESVFNKSAGAGRSIVTVTVENRGNAGAEVPIILHMQNEELSQRLEVRARSKATIRFAATSAPLEIVVNDGSVPESDTGNNTFKIEAPTK